jgi:hypothetical protein
MVAFAEMALPQFVHETPIASIQKDRLIVHIARDFTVIEAARRLPKLSAPTTKSGSQRMARCRGKSKGKTSPTGIRATSPDIGRAKIGGCIVSAAGNCRKC